MPRRWYKFDAQKASKESIARGDNEVDPEIIPLLTELNIRGFKTTCSCAGHRRSERGEIIFSKIKGDKLGRYRWLRKAELEEIKQIMKYYGYRNISWVRPGILSFTAMGKMGGSR